MSAITSQNTYVSLHTHSEHSLGDGISKADDLVKRASELGMPAMALTDHGRMSGLIAFEKACHDHGVRPILGMEAYITGIGRSRTERVNYTGDTRDLVGKPGHEKTNYHLILLAKNQKGYDNLCRMTTESFSTGFYYKPRIDYELLKECHEGLVVSSACVLGELSMAVQDHDIQKARAVIEWYRGVFDDDYYIEVQNHGLRQELEAMQTLRELADEYDIPTIVTNDSHYTYKEDAKLQKTIMLINRKKSWADSDVRGSFFGDDDMAERQSALSDDGGDSDPIFETSSELYVKSYDEMVEACRVNGGEDGRVERELANTLEVADKCKYEMQFIDPSDTDAYILPKYDIKTDVRYDEYERSSFAMPAYIEKACVRELHDEGHEDVQTLSDYMSDDDIESLRFLMWLCEDGLKRRVVPKIKAGGKPMPDDMWIRNKPQGLHVVHTHMSPDERWVAKQIADGKTDKDMIGEYRDRLAYETGVVVAKKFVNYFLIVQSYVNYVKAQGEMVGTGRGSGAGSLLNYLSGITSVDPIPNNLLFFRFLNKDRKGYPDIDCDFSGHARDDILWPHLREVYGKPNTAMVAAYGMFWGKAAIKAAARVLFDRSNDKECSPDVRSQSKRESITLMDNLCNLIDNRPKLDLREELTEDVDPSGRPLGNVRLQELIKTDVRYRQIIDLALRLQGMISGESQHASAYILSPHPIVDKLPLMVSKDEREASQKTGEPIQDYIIQYDGREIQDQLGYVKMDLLCINDLEVITQTIKKIHDVYGIDIDIDNIPLDCKTTFDLLQQGKTAGVFQFDGSSVPRRLIVEGHASNINDLSMINALDRPGALLMNMDKEFVNVKNNPQLIHYFTPAAKDVLEDTYSLPVYQEETMLLSQNKQIVGLTESESDTMRKILAHKDKSKIQWIVDLAHERAEQNNVPKSIVDQFCDLAVASGSYQFNHCTTGDTMLHRAGRNNRDKKYPTCDISIEEIYRRFNASAARNSPDAPIRSKYRSKDPNRGLFVICRDSDGQARKHKVKNVFKQGVQPVYRVTLENGKNGKFTANHRLQAENGYKMVAELEPEKDALWCCDFEYEKCHKRYNWSDIKDGKHKGSRAIGKHNYGSGKDSIFYTNGGYTAFKQYHDSFDGVCEMCGRKLEPGERYETHHIDGNRKNNDPSNLQNLCVSCHEKAHYAMGRVRHGQKGYPTYLSKVVSVEYVGEEMTYDVEIDSEEHNFFANGICSHNSHSLAYAIIAYRGAFLKTFFPDCFLASVSQIKPKMKQEDKIPDYLSEARQHGVRLLPPNVNWSDVGFSVPQPHEISYGLERIKGVGAAAQMIVDERQRNGQYTDLSDFLYRVPRAVSAGPIKALIASGAMDGLGWTRKALEENTDAVIDFRKALLKRDGKKCASQMSLFSTGTSIIDVHGQVIGNAASATEAFNDGQRHNDHDSIIVPPTTEEWSDFELMRKEHDQFGMYFDRTPEDYTQLTRLEMDDRLESRRKENAHKHVAGVTIGGKSYQMVNIGDVPGMPDGERVVFTARVDDVTSKFTETHGYREFKSGKGATVFLVDWGVGAEGRFGFSPAERRLRLTCFSRLWSQVPKPSPNAIIVAWGRVSVSDKFPTSVIADDLRVLPYDMVKFAGRGQDAERLMEELKSIAARESDPSSSDYMVPRLEFKDEPTMRQFMQDKAMHARYDDLYGTVMLAYSDMTAGNEIVMRLAKTMGLVRYAHDRYGASVKKAQLPIAASELARRF